MVFSLEEVIPEENARKVFEYLASIRAISPDDAMGIGGVCRDLGMSLEEVNAAVSTLYDLVEEDVGSKENARYLYISEHGAEMYSKMLSELR